MGKMERAEAEQVMGLSGKYDASVLRERRRELVKRYHPDLAQQNGLTKEEAEAKTIELQSAFSTLDSLVRLRGEVTAMGSAGTSTTIPRPSTGQSPQDGSEYRWGGDASTARASAQGQSDARQQHSTSEQSYYSPQQAYTQTKPYREPMLRRIIEHFPYRLGFIVLSFAITYMLTGSDVVALSSDIGESSPELFFLLLGLTAAAFLNLFTGTVTIAAKQACLWFYDKFIAKTEFPESVRHAIFGHLPYRIIFLVFSIWWYWDFATFHVAESGPLDWPLRVLVFLAAGVNFMLPFVTSPIRAILAGDEY